MKLTNILICKGIKTCQLQELHVRNSKPICQSFNSIMSNNKVYIQQISYKPKREQSRELFISNYLWLSPNITDFYFQDGREKQQMLKAIYLMVIRSCRFQKLPIKIDDFLCMGLQCNPSFVDMRLCHSSDLINIGLGILFCFLLWHTTKSIIK